MDLQKKENRSALASYSTYAGMGLQMVLVMGGAMWVGMQLDRYTGWRFPVFLVLFSLTSTVLVMYVTIRKLLHTLHHTSKHSTTAFKPGNTAMEEKPIDKASGTTEKIK
jgi:hypothetical protein